MTHNARTPIIITDAYWKHIRHTRIRHRHYPEIRGEGRLLEEAADHLANQLIRALDSAHGRRGREAIERALADVRPFQSGRPRQRAPHRDAAAPSELSTIV